MPTRRKRGPRQRDEWTLESELDELCGSDVVENKADRICQFFEKVLVHTKGEWAGLPFKLLPWQRDGVLTPLFGVLNGDGSRQYRTAYVEIPKKNGKSELAAGIALYLLLADGEPGAEVYGAAGDRDQASIVFNVAADMIRLSPVLNKWLGAGRIHIVDSTKRIVDTKTRSYYKALSSETASKHGYNVHGLVFDELHIQPNRELWDTLTKGIAARRQPLIFAITTAGYDRNSICWEQHDYADKILNDVIDDPTFLPVIYGAKNKETWANPETWHEANPSLGVTISEDYIQHEADFASEVPAALNTFLRLHLNIWTQQESRWITLESWDSCANAVDVDDLRGRVCYGGLDLAATTDIAAFVLVFPDGDGNYDVLPYFWVPEDSIELRSRRDRVPYDVWARAGFIRSTPGNVIDYAYIRHTLEELADTYSISSIGFDRWGATQLVQELQEIGLSVIPFGQGYASMSSPTKELEKIILAGKLSHGGNPVLRWMADNMTVSQDPAGNIKPDKGKAREKIDGIVALIMAIDRATREQGSVYEERGVLVL